MNNRVENYERSMETGENLQLHKWWNWNPESPNTWTMMDCVVTSVVLENGLTMNDEIVGKPIVINPGSSLPKIVDIDTAHRNSSSVFGMKLGVNWSTDGKSRNSFFGDFIPSPLTHEPWIRQTDGSMFANLGARGVSQLSNVRWSDHLTSEALERLKTLTSRDKTNGYTLSIMLSLFDYTMSSDRRFYGKLVGSIGITTLGESLVFPANRVLLFTKNPPLPVPYQSRMCMYNWTNTAYFDIFASRMTIDLSNSLALNINSDVCHFYPYYAGVLTDQQTVEILGEIPYMEKDWYWKTSGIQDINLTRSQLERAKSHQIVVVVFKEEPPSEINHLRFPICENSLTNDIDSCLYVILRETAYLVRPLNRYIYRLEKGDLVQVNLKVKHYGNQPSKHIPVTLCDSSRNVPAKKSDLEFQSTQITNDAGIATFTFVAGDVGSPRKGIDGQLFQFNYCVCEDCETVNCSQCEAKGGNQIVFLVWSDIKYQMPYYWDTHVKPIFTQYQNLYPAMNKIVKLGDYDDVTKPRNIDMILFSMSLDTNHSSYMPVTRDLSPLKRKMIIKWLKTPDHPRNREDDMLYESPPFCHQTYLYNEEKQKIEEARIQIEDSFPWMKQYRSSGYMRMLLGETEDILPTLADSQVTRSFFDVATVTLPTYDRIPRSVSPHKSGYSRLLSAILNLDRKPLPNWYTYHCSKQLLKEMLQLAVQLEFSTIPPYLTALYSIKDGYNREAYELIRSVVMQEMLHLAQAANLLIAIGGRPVIDSAQAVPSYPGKIPGGVLPGLNVTLQKASPKYIADVFMMIEFPDNIIYKDHHTEKGIEAHVVTIGKLYKRIQQCMIELYEKERDNLFKTEVKQLSWPWKEHEEGIKLTTVTNIEEAIEAINMIIEEGEGTPQRDPTYLKTLELAHFFKFEMLACKHHLRVLHDNDQYMYDFRGKKIEFTSEGVWPMRNNPSSKTIPRKSLAYRETKIFHSLYRSLLSLFQESFDGRPDAIKEAVPIMEAMQLQAKNLMTMEVPSKPGHPKQTYGPTFEYEMLEA